MRNELHPAYILHTRDYRETSLIIELFTQHQGRVAVLGRGIKRKPGIHQSFVPMMVAYQGRGELQTLTAIEAADLGFYFKGTALLSALYLNELLMRVLSARDPFPRLYSRYEQILKDIADNKQIAVLLRVFEKHLLTELGYGINLSTEAESVDAIIPERYYRFQSQEGFVLVNRPNTHDSLIFSGNSIIALEKEKFTTPQTLQDAKVILRLALAPILGHRAIKSRELLGGTSP